jgi:hypothetical protein
MEIVESSVFDVEGTITDHHYVARFWCPSSKFTWVLRSLSGQRSTETMEPVRHRCRRSDQRHNYLALFSAFEFRVCFRKRFRAPAGFRASNAMHCSAGT